MVQWVGMVNFMSLGGWALFRYTRAFASRWCWLCINLALLDHINGCLEMIYWKGLDFECSKRSGWSRIVSRYSSSC